MFSVNAKDCLEDEQLSVKVARTVKDDGSQMKIDWSLLDEITTSPSIIRFGIF